MRAAIVARAVVVFISTSISMSAGAQKLPLSMSGDEAPPPPTAAAGVPDASFFAMKDRDVRLVLRDGRHLDGRLIAVAPESVTIVQRDDSAVLTVARADVAVLQASRGAPAEPVQEEAPMAEPSRAARAARSEALAPDLNRHIGLNLGAGPIVVAVDFDYRPFYGFVSSGLALPLFTTDHRGASTVGLGGSWRITPRTNWQFDLFAHASVAWGFPDSQFTCDGFGNCRTISSSGTYVAFGVGAGFHYTFSSGFTFAVKAPIIGGAFGGPVKDAPTSGAFYYLAAAVSFPLATIGYRF